MSPGRKIKSPASQAHIASSRLPTVIHASGRSYFSSAMQTNGKEKATAIGTPPNNTSGQLVRAVSLKANVIPIRMAAPVHPTTSARQTCGAERSRTIVATGFTLDDRRRRHMRACPHGPFRNESSDAPHHFHRERGRIALVRPPNAALRRVKRLSGSPQQSPLIQTAIFIHPVNTAPACPNDLVPLRRTRPASRGSWRSGAEGFFLRLFRLARPS